jgi:tRNA pseudouridine38-40 synthase
MSGKPERNFSARTAYDGTAYAGFQLQPNEPTIQGELETAIAKVLGSDVRVHAASRTDAGVHAIGQVISFRSTTVLPAGEIERAVNAHLPPDVRIGPVLERHDDFHARFSARGKRYNYRFYRGEVESPFLSRYALWVRGCFDVGRMKNLAMGLQGKRDFQSFTPRLYEGEEPVKSLEGVRVEEQDDLVEVSMVASGFLYQMARRISGALLEAARGKLDWSEVQRWLENPVLGTCKFLVPSKGLFLMEVMY